MSENNLQQTRHNRQEIIYYSSIGMYDPNKFATWLESAFQESRFKSYAELGESAGLSRSTIAAFAKAKKQTANDKPSQPKAENVIKIANALNRDVNEALLSAGHAPLNDDTQGNFRGFDKVPPHLRDLARKQVNDLIKNFEESGVEPTFDYGNFDEEK